MAGSLARSSVAGLNVGLGEGLPMADKVKLTDSLLKRAHKAAVRFAALNAKITAAFEQRYGCTYSDVDCDHLIDSLDYGQGGAPSVADCDRDMVGCGRALLSSGKTGE